MATLQIRVDDSLKQAADTLFSSLGLDTPTAVHIFLNVAVENEGIPFPVLRRPLTASFQEAIRCSRSRQNLNGPFDTEKESVKAMLEG